MGECQDVSLGALNPHCQNPGLEPVECSVLTQCFRQFMCSVFVPAPKDFSPVTCAANSETFFCQCFQPKLLLISRTTTTRPTAPSVDVTTENSWIFDNSNRVMTSVQPPQTTDPSSTLLPDPLGAALSTTTEAPDGLGDDRSLFHLSPRPTRSSTFHDHRNPDGLGGGAIAGIVIGVLVGLLLLGLVAFFVVRKIKERRKTQGVYFPKAEEEKNTGKDFHYLPPPAIEGLI